MSKVAPLPISLPRLEVSSAAPAEAAPAVQPVQAVQAVGHEGWTDTVEETALDVEKSETKLSNLAAPINYGKMESEYQFPHESISSMRFFFVCFRV
jgi:hypothetical protein